jgi:DNA-binding transcriptional ArsR family regulator
MNSYQRQAEVHRALAHPVRVRILEVLSREEACVCHLTAILRKPQPYVSQQLSMLKEAHLVADRREGTLIYYRLSNEPVAALLAAGRSAALGEGDPGGGSPAVAAVPEGPVPGCPCPRCQQAQALVRGPEGAPSETLPTGCAEGAA